MKIKLIHYNYIKERVDELLASDPNIVRWYESGEFLSASKVKDVQRRFCFDVMRAAVGSRWVCDEIYPYANDDHLYTALRRICPQLKPTVR